jgi:hypothetical protein
VHLEPFGEYSKILRSIRDMASNFSLHNFSCLHGDVLCKWLQDRENLEVRTDDVDADGHYIELIILRPKIIYT